MIAARLLLMLNSALFSLFGLLYLIWPTAMCATLHLVATRPTAIVDVRATYGGMQLGIAALLAYCAISIGGTAFGLLSAACIVGGLAVGRLIGIAANGGTSGLVWLIVGVEVTATIINVWMLRRLQQRDHA
jgi:hypothetical protein